jgi:hypothetical protein
MRTLPWSPRHCAAPYQNVRGRAACCIANCSKLLRWVRPSRRPSPGHSGGLHISLDRDLDAASSKRVRKSTPTPGFTRSNQYGYGCGVVTLCLVGRNATWEEGRPPKLGAAWDTWRTSLSAFRSRRGVRRLHAPGRHRDIEHLFILFGAGRILATAVAYATRRAGMSERTGPSRLS